MSAPLHNRNPLGTSSVYAAVHRALGGRRCGYRAEDLDRESWDRCHVAAVPAFRPGGGTPGDLDDDATLTLLSQGSMMFQDSEVEMQDRVDAFGTTVGGAVDHDVQPECLDAA